MTDVCLQPALRQSRSKLRCESQGPGFDARWRLRYEFQGAGGLGTLCGIQGVELFFGDGGVLVVGGAGFVYVVFGPELA